MTEQMTKFFDQMNSRMSNMESALRSHTEKIPKMFKEKKKVFT